MATALAVSCAARGDVFTSGCTPQAGHLCTLAQLLSDPAAYVEIDGARFHNFAEFNIPLELASHIAVSAVDGAGGADRPGNVVGLEFAAFDGSPALLEGYDSRSFELSIKISYDIDVKAGLRIGATDTSVRFADVQFGAGSGVLQGGLTKTIARPGLAGVTVHPYCSVTDTTAWTCPANVAIANATFGPVRRLSVQDTLFIAHFAPLPGDLAASATAGMQIRSFRQAWFRVSEPGSPALFAIGVAGMLAAWRRRRSAPPAPATGTRR